MLSKSSLKYLVYYQVFCVEVRRLQDQHIYIYIWAFVFCYCISKDLPREKNYKTTEYVNKLNINILICFLTKYNFFSIKMQRLLLLFDFFPFFVFLSLFSMSLFYLLLYQAIFRRFAFFYRRFFFIFKESTLQYLKKY